MTIERTAWDLDRAAHLQSSHYRLPRAGVQSGRSALIAAALGDVARAHGMTEIARAASVTRDMLYKALSKDGDPWLSTFRGVTKALGLKIHVAA